MSEGNITKFRVLVVDDSSVTRLGVVTLIDSQPDMSVVGEAEDGTAALARFRELRPDLVVVDLRMPGLSGVDVTAAICTLDPAARVLVLTSYDGEENIFQALKAGALGYLTKEAPGREILNALRTIATGTRYLPPGIAHQLAERMLHPSLSPRELQVLREIAQGQSNKEIAQSLGISLKTTAMFVASILDKLDVKSRTEAVAVALKRGIITPP